MVKLTDPIFTDANEAREHLERLNWPNGPVCPHCGETERVRRLEGKSHRSGLIQCNACTKNFTVTVGTVFERSKVPLNKWLLATYLLCSSKKGMSAKQIERMLGVTYKTAWFMCHRIREAMKPTDPSPLGGPGSDIEADETFFGRDRHAPKSRAPFRNMNKIVSLIDRKTGRSTSIVFTPSLTADNVGSYLFSKVDRRSRLLTDQAKHYIRPGKSFARHGSVNHARDEYVSKSDPSIHTNTVEGFFGIFKRGMRGIYQHCDQRHLHRYLAEFDFRYSNRSGLGIDDGQRTDIALQGIVGKRLTYRRVGPLAA